MSDEQPAHAPSPAIDPALRLKLAWMFGGNYVAAKHAARVGLLIHARPI
jgi:hypothetical protein